MRGTFGFLLAGGLMVGVGVGALAVIPPKPDLRCTELTVEKLQTMQVPLRVKVHFAVKNVGPGNSESFTTRLSYRKGTSGSWTTFREFPSPFTPVGGGAAWNPTIDLNEGGTYTFKVEVDVYGKIAETVEGNNIRTVTKTFQAGTPDLTVVNVDARITRTTSTGTVYTTVTWDVQNIGDGKAQPTFVTVIKVSKNGGSFAELARYSRSNLAASASYHYVDNHSFTNVTRLKFRIQTDATNTVYERSNSNNSADSQLLQM